MVYDYETNKFKINDLGDSRSIGWSDYHIIYMFIINFFYLSYFLLTPKIFLYFPGKYEERTLYYINLLVCREGTFLNFNYLN
jgi:hypothetical protein